MKTTHFLYELKHDAVLSQRRMHRVGHGTNLTKVRAWKRDRNWMKSWGDIGRHFIIISVKGEYMSRSGHVKNELVSVWAEHLAKKCLKYGATHMAKWTGHGYSVNGEWFSPDGREWFSGSRKPLSAAQGKECREAWFLFVDGPLHGRISAPDRVESTWSNA